MINIGSARSFRIHDVLNFLPCDVPGDWKKYGLVCSGLMSLARLVEQAAAQYCQVWSPERRHECEINGLAAVGVVSTCCESLVSAVSCGIVMGLGNLYSVVSQGKEVDSLVFRWLNAHFCNASQQRTRHRDTNALCSRQITGCMAALKYKP